jgi:hypothetical protein
MVFCALTELIIYLSIRNTNRQPVCWVGLGGGDAPGGEVCGGLKGLDSGKCSTAGKNLVVKDVAVRRHIAGSAFTSRRGPRCRRKKGGLGTSRWKIASTTNKDEEESS